MKTNSPSAGFTLLEVMVAVAILAIGMVSLFQLFSGALRSAKVSSDYSKAVIGAQKKMDEVFGYLYYEDFQEMAQRGEFDGEEDSLLEGYKWEISEEDADDITQELDEEWAEHHTLEEKKFMLKKIIVQVSWPSTGKEKKFRLVTLKMFYEEDD